MPMDHTPHPSRRSIKKTLAIIFASATLFYLAALIAWSYVSQQELPRLLWVCVVIPGLLALLFEALARRGEEKV